MSDIEIRVPELGDLKGADVVAIPATIGASPGSWSAWATA